VVDSSMSEVKKPDYSSPEYCTPYRMASYGYQIKEVISQKPRTVLETGIGNGVVTYLLRRAGIDVTTLDRDKQVKPDVVGSILELPFESNTFHGALCCQVLEHLPFDKFAQALRELCRVTRKFAVISLPDASRHYRLDIKVPKVYERLPVGAVRSQF
jgi:ubiquinone/menaquinone biosynthesis C-methylase UbiE